jgi:hypothetical protein
MKIRSKFLREEVAAARLNVILPDPHVSMSDLKPLHSNFSLWVNEGDLNWASWMWPILTSKGLAKAACALEKFESIKNFICLALIYKDFWSCFEGFELDIVEPCLWFEQIVDGFPELAHLVSPEDHDTLFVSVHDTERRHKIYDAIHGYYALKYPSPNEFHDDAAVAIFNDLIATRPKETFECIEEIQKQHYHPMFLLHRGDIDVLDYTTRPTYNEYNIGEAYLFILVGRMNSL